MDIIFLRDGTFVSVRTRKIFCAQAQIQPLIFTAFTVYTPKMMYTHGVGGIHTSTHVHTARCGHLYIFIIFLLYIYNKIFRGNVFRLTAMCVDFLRCKL
jgi:hypothetical protein